MVARIRCRSRGFLKNIFEDKIKHDYGNYQRKETDIDNVYKKRESYSNNMLELVSGGLDLLHMWS